MDIDHLSSSDDYTYHKIFRPYTIVRLLVRTESVVSGL